MRPSAAATSGGFWTKRLAGSAAVLLLVAVPALGVFHLAPALLSVGRGFGLDAGFTAGLFEAPTVTLNKVQPEVGPGEPLVFTDWQFTETGDYSHSTVSADPIQRMTERLDYLALLQGDRPLSPLLGNTYAGLLVGDQQALQAAINSGRISAADPKVARVQSRATQVFHDVMAASSGGSGTFLPVSPPSSPFE